MSFLKISRLISCQWKVAVLLYAMPVGLVQVVGETNENLNTTTREPIASNIIIALDVTSAIALAVCVVGILSNSLLIVVVCCNPLNNLRRLSWFTIINLTVADLWTSIATISFCYPVEDQIVKSSYEKARSLANGFLYMGYFSSFFLMLLLSIERYIAVKYPMQSRIIMTNKRICGAIILCWAAGIGFGGVSIHNYSGSMKLIIGFGVYVILELTVLLMILFLVLLVRSIMANSHMVVNTTRETKIRNISTTVVIMILILMVTAFPYFIAKQLEFLKRMDIHLFTSQTLRLFPYYYFPIASLNFVVNPFIYAWRLPEYRWSFVALVQRKLLCKETTVQTNSQKIGLVSRTTNLTATTSC